MLSPLVFFKHLSQSNITNTKQKKKQQKKEKIPCLQAQVFASQLFDLILQLETSKSVHTNKNKQPTILGHCSPDSKKLELTGVS